MYKRIDYNDRLIIEKMLKGKAPVAEIAKVIGKSRKSVYYEIKKGQCLLYGRDYKKVQEYSAKVAQDQTDINYTAHGVNLKIGNNHKAAKDIERYILCGFSPYAVSVLLERNGVISLSKNTIYNYIYRGFIGGVTSENLIHGRRKRSYSHVVKKNKRIYGTSIEKRPAEIMERLEYGHWEMDTVYSKVSRPACLLVLTERKTRYEIIIKLQSKTSGEVVKAIHGLYKAYGKQFSRIFKTITCDNGGEFAYANIVQGYGTKLYFAHPYSAFERGSNENLNRMIRRRYPKGTDFTDVSHEDVRHLQDWMNNYPRLILGGYSAAEVAEACMAG